MAVSNTALFGALARTELQLQNNKTLIVLSRHDIRLIFRPQNVFYVLGLLPEIQQFLVAKPFDLQVERNIVNLAETSCHLRSLSCMTSAPRAPASARCVDGVFV